MGISTASGWKKHEQNVFQRAEPWETAVGYPGPRTRTCPLLAAREGQPRHSNHPVGLCFASHGRLDFPSWFCLPWNQKQNHQRGIEHLGIYLESACFVKNVVFICSTSPQNRKGIDHFIDSHFSNFSIGCFFSIVFWWYLFAIHIF